MTPAEVQIVGGLACRAMACSGAQQCPRGAGDRERFAFSEQETVVDEQLDESERPNQQEPLLS